MGAGPELGIYIYVKLKYNDIKNTHFERRLVPLGSSGPLWAALGLLWGHSELLWAPLCGSGLPWAYSGPALGSSGLLWPPLACSGLLWGPGWLPLFPGTGPELEMYTFLIDKQYIINHAF